MALKLPPDWTHIADWADALRDTPITRKLTDARLLPRTLVRAVFVLDQHIREGRFQRSLALIAGGSALLGAIGNKD
jgi:hypothetical protein